MSDHLNAVADKLARAILAAKITAYYLPPCTWEDLPLESKRLYLQHAQELLTKVQPQTQGADTFGGEAHVKP